MNIPHALKILFVCPVTPTRQAHGGLLRLFSAARALSRRAECHLALFGDVPPREDWAYDAPDFATILPLPAGPVPHGGGLPWRLLRLSNERYFRRCDRQAFQAVTAALRAHVEATGVQVATAPLEVYEYVSALENVARVADAYDCLTLTAEREREQADDGAPWLARWKRALEYRRTKTYESRLHRLSDAVVAISPADRDRLEQLMGRPGAVRIIPNGVDLAPARPPRVDRPPRAVAFWGNLAFPPNKAAIRHFYRDVFRPFLREQGVVWRVIGANPDPEILRLGSEEPNIVVTGFAEDLDAALADAPVMVNPMVIGSGLKNKVLEAFAREMAVVSTPRGMEAVVGARDGEHCALASSPETFAAQVTRLLDAPQAARAMGAQARELVRRHYLWDQVGGQWEALFRDILDRKRTPTQTRRGWSAPENAGGPACSAR